MIWRLLSQLTELMPHLARLVPLLERFGVGGLAAADVAALQASLEGRMGAMTDGHKTLQMQLKDHTVQMAAVEAKLEELRMQMTRLQAEMNDAAAAQQKAQMRLGVLMGLVVLLVIAVGIVLALMLVGRR
jgi:hypothetical protein